ncbi:glycosyltransferase family 2 protein [Tepidibacter mesophilus]|uniref:glycosyltransferase family 2 protein n=1 Tax=Tepidibacter mesophilus TaxID=655607 RepID=UPI000C078AD0|nr:glycosyltransferase family 2 protein [Tepidibacter mesophilus]
MKPKISMILPIYNVEEYIEEALESIINQTMGIENLEVIMVNDGSADNSRLIIDEYAGKYKNFKSFHFDKPSGAAGSPRNFGIQKAIGEYIMFLDPDDLYTSNACELLYNTAKKYDSDIVMGTFELFNSKKQWQHPLFIKSSNKMFPNKLIEPKINLKIEESPELLMAPAIAVTKIFKSDFIKDKDINFPEGMVSEDAVFAVESFLLAEKISFIPHTVYRYRQRENDRNPSITQKPKLKFFQDFSESRKIIISLYEEHSILKYKQVRYLLDLEHLIFKLSQTNYLSYERRVDILDTVYWFIYKSKDFELAPNDIGTKYILDFIIDKKYNRAFKLIYIKRSKMYRIINKIVNYLPTTKK